jgi:hypothetical protein
MPIEDTGWKQPNVEQTPEGPKGLITTATGTEKRPCYLCARWERDQRKLIEFFVSRGLRPDVNGEFETPIARDFRGRRSMRVDPKNWGYCRQQCIATDMNATCENWELTRTRADLAGKIR